MNLFSIENLTVEEISLLRQSLNVIDIKGASAIFVATLQVKLDQELSQIRNMIAEEENKKQAGIRKIEKAAKAEL
jgi:hypothetical protein